MLKPMDTPFAHSTGEGLEGRAGGGRSPRLSKSARAWYSLLLCLALLTGCGDGGMDVGLDQHGQPVAAERLQGKWLVINYWAIWCAPCRREIPELNQLAGQLAGRAEVFAVNFDGVQGEALASDAAELGIRFTVLARDPASLFKLPRSTALPVTYLIDPDGKLRASLLGEQTAAGISDKLALLQGR